MLINYDAKCQEVKSKFEEFIDAAEKGREGHGSKTHALKARKASTEISMLLKDFRAISISNDKAKPVKSRTPQV